MPFPRQYEPIAGTAVLDSSERCPAPGFLLDDRILSHESRAKPSDWRSPNPGVTMRSLDRGWGSFTEAKEAGESGEVGVGEERNTGRVIGSGSRGRVVIPREPREVGVGEGHNTRIRGVALQVLHLQEWDCFSRNPSISTACL